MKQNKKNRINYWAAIAAENDTTGRCQYNYYILITSKNLQLDSYKRGLYWLYKSVHLGDSYAKACSDFNPENSAWLAMITKEKFVLPITDTSKLDAYIEAGLLGSGEAALNLAVYYKNTGNQDKYKYWCHLGSQNGNTECIKEYILLLRNSANKNDSIRSEFWTDRVQAN